MRKMAREAVIFALLGVLFASVWFCIQETHNFRRAETDRALSDVRDATASDDPAYRILFVAQNVENRTRAEAWKVFYQSKDMDEFIRRLDALSLPLTMKADLWEARVPCSIGADFIPVPSWLYEGNPALKDWKKTADMGHPNKELVTPWDTHGHPVPPVAAPVTAWDEKGKPLPAGLVPIYCDKISSPPAGYYLGFPDSLRWPEPRATQLQALTHVVPPGAFMGLIIGFPAGLGVWLFYRLVRFAILG